MLGGLKRGQRSIPERELWLLNLDLGSGGAERQLMGLLRGRPFARLTPLVVLLAAKGLKKRPKLIWSVHSDLVLTVS